MWRARLSVLKPAARWKTSSIAAAGISAREINAARSARGRPANHVDRAGDDRLQFPARHAGAGADRDGVDGGGGEMREYGGIGAVGQFALLFRTAEAGGEGLVEFDEALQHHGADFGIGYRFRGRGHHREAAARSEL